jgi:hypothetical protein
MAQVNDSLINGVSNKQGQEDAFAALRAASLAEQNMARKNKPEPPAGLKTEEEPINLNDITIFFIESSKGWFYDTQELLNFVSNNTIFLWVEDHICLDLDFFDLVLSDLIKYKIDYLQYSFWLNGLLLQQYSDIEMKESDTMYFFEHNQVTHLNFKKRYINSLVGIYSKKLFSKIIFRKDFVQLWPTNVPFDFERPSWDTSILPFIRGVSKKEIFASIDDCQDVPGSSLIGRGIYTKSIGRLSNLPRL